VDSGRDSLRGGIKISKQQIEWLHTRERNVFPKQNLIQNTISSKLHEAAENKAKLHEQAARFIYATNLPFETVNHPEFVKFVKLLRPSYNPPSAYVIGSSLLETIHHSITSEAKEQMHGKFVTILQDGWSSTHGVPVISHSLSVEGNRIFHLNAVNCHSNSKTARYCHELLQDAILTAETQYGCIVGALITDNCNTMLALHNLVRESRPDMFVFGCNTHLLNLIGKEITDGNLIEKVKKIQHFFKDHDYTREELRKLKGFQPVFPCDTRWNSQFACLQNYLKNHSIYFEIAKQPEAKATPEVLILLSDISFFKSIELAAKNMEPIVKAIENVITSLLF